MGATKKKTNVPQIKQKYHNFPPKPSAILSTTWGWAQNSNLLITKGSNHIRNWNNVIRMNELQAFKINFTDSNMFTLRYQSLKPKKIPGSRSESH